MSGDDCCRVLEVLPPAARGPLYGVPFAVKDNIDVAGFPTTAACEAYRYTPSQSAPGVEALLEAGAHLFLDQHCSSKCMHSYASGNFSPRMH